jgi:hypothetical protein
MPDRLMPVPLPLPLLLALEDENTNADEGGRLVDDENQRESSVDAANDDFFDSYYGDDTYYGDDDYERFERDGHNFGEVDMAGAVRILHDGVPRDGRAARSLDVEVSRGFRVQEQNQRATVGPQFHELVRSLEGHRHIWKLTIVNASFRHGNDGDDDDDDDAPVNPLTYVPEPPWAEDIERFFGSTLRRHPSLKEIIFRRTFIQTDYLRLLTLSITASAPMSLSKLTFQHTPLGEAGCRLICSALQGNMRIEALCIEWCLVEAEGWRIVCSGAAANRHLRTLLLWERGGVAVPPPPESWAPSWGRSRR